MKPALLVLPLLAFTALASHGQLAADLQPVTAKSTSGPAEQDRQWQSGMDQSKDRIEASLKDYLVVFEAPQTSERRRVGIPLTSFANNSVNIAYDSTGKNLMAQWKLFQTDERGNKINYHAYLGASGSVSLLISARF